MRCRDYGGEGRKAAEGEAGLPTPPATSFPAVVIVGRGGQIEENPPHLNSTPGK